MALTTGIIFGILAMLGWGIADFFAKKAIEKIGAYRSFIYSYLFGVIPLIVYFMFFPEFTSLSTLLIILFIFEGFVNFLGYLFFYKGLEIEKVSILSPIVACNPIIVILLGILILKEILSLNQGIGIGIAITGLILVSFQNKKFKITTKGIFLGISTMFSWGIALFIFGYLVKESNWILAALLARSLTWFYGFAYLKIRNIPLKIPKINLFHIIILVGVLDMLGTVFYSLGATTELISLVGPVSALYPAITLILARLFIREKLFSIQKIGIIAILLGLLLISI